MKKIMIILVFLVITTIQANDTYTLNEFAKKVASHNNINIYIDEDFKNKQVSLYIPRVITNQELFKLFKNTINNLDYNLKDIGGTYYLSKKISYKTNNYLYKLKYNSYKDCLSILKILEVKNKYLENSNSFLISSTKHKYKEVISFLNQVDTKQKQVILKIMILEFQEDEVKETGIQYASIYNSVYGGLEVSLNAIVAPISTSSNILSNTSFYGALRFLNEEEKVNVRQYPYILAKNNKKFLFEAVENIPYLVQTTTTDATNTSEQNSIDYKDVGLKIYGKTLIYDDYITLDLDLIIEDLMDTNSDDNLPRTYKRRLNSNTNVEYNKVLLLSGIKRDKKSIINLNIPFISNIPYLGEIFKYSFDSKNTLNITIAIEVLDNIESFNSVNYQSENNQILLGDL